MKLKLFFSLVFLTFILLLVNQRFTFLPSLRAEPESCAIKSEAKIRSKEKIFLTKLFGDELTLAELKNVSENTKKKGFTIEICREKGTVGIEKSFFITSLMQIDLPATIESLNPGAEAEILEFVKYEISFETFRNLVFFGQNNGLEYQITDKVTTIKNNSISNDYLSSWERTKRKEIETISDIENEREQFLAWRELLKKLDQTETNFQEMKIFWDELTKTENQPSLNKLQNLLTNQLTIEEKEYAIGGLKISPILSFNNLNQLIGEQLLALAEDDIDFNQFKLALDAQKVQEDQIDEGEDGENETPDTGTPDDAQPPTETENNNQIKSENLGKKYWWAFLIGGFSLLLLILLLVLYLSKKKKNGS